MSDIIRLAKNLYGKNYGRLAEEAGLVKSEYVSAGGNPEDVYSPERTAALSNGGPLALLRAESEVRNDGSIAGPYVPTPLAIAKNMIEPSALPAVVEANLHGIDTVSSGVDKATGKGFAIGRDPNGNVVKLLR